MINNNPFDSYVLLDELELKEKKEREDFPPISGDFDGTKAQKEDFDFEPEVKEIDKELYKID